MRNAKTRVWSIVLTLAMLLSLLPVSAMAVWDTRAGEADNPLTATSNNITVNKYVSGNAADGYSLTLEAYAANQQTTTTTTTPLDIVLVLDVSGSMAYNFNGRQEDDPEEQRITALKAAVNSFIDSVAENAARSGADHQISIVKFAGDWSDAIGNDTYRVNIGLIIPNYVYYNYSQVVASLTSVSSGADELKRQVNDLTASGATQADYGMLHAQSVLEDSQRESKKVVIMFTDGQPTSGSSYEDAVAHGAINTAKELKDEGVTVYTIGIFGGADPSNTSEQTNRYMNAVSSKYPNAVSESSGGYRPRYTVTLGSPVDGSYYFASSSAEGLEDVFKTIANTVTSNTLTANPDIEAVLSDTLSEYFNFPEELAAGDTSGVTVKMVPVTGKSGDSYSWGSPVDITDEVSVTVSGDSINITGFDYKANAVTESTEGGETTYGGYKLVVTFPIEVDMDACVSDPQESHSYPTNNVTHSKAGLFYKSEDAESNDTYTTLSASPTVTIAELDANGTDVTVQVYVDGEPVTDPLDYITLERSTNDTAYSYFKATVCPDGTVSCDFNYSPTGGNHDCVDLEVTVNSSAYVLNGVNSYQSHGMNGTNNVTPSGRAYIIDNVTASPDNDVDCTIYLRSAYSVEYYQGGKLTEEPYDDQNTYVVTADVAASTAQEDYPAEGSSAWMDWKNDETLTSISLPALPSVTGSDVYGWFLGSEDGTKYEPSGSVNMTDAVSSAEGSVIKFYATASANRYTITINYQDAESGALQDAYTDTQDYNYEYSFDVSEEDEAVIPFIIVKDDTNYVFDHFAEGSDPLSGTLTDSVEITAVYLIDENGNEVPDAYEATVTYKVVNGTWADDTNVDKTEDFVLKTFDADSNAWVAATPTPTLDDTIPTGMKPVTGYADNGAWDTEINSETEVTGAATYTYTFGTRMYSITINYQDEDGSALQDAYTATQNDGYEYSFDVSADATGEIPFIIVKEGTNYVFDRFADGSDPLSGTLTDSVEITAVYLIDENGNEVPDAYEATVTYKVVNGTWADDTNVDKTEDFVLKTFDADSNAWVAATPTPTLDDTIPAGMKPDANHMGSGAWNTDISADTEVTADVTYTYTFGTEKAPALTVDKTVTSVGGTAVSDQSNIPSATAGDVIEYQIVVENSGNVALSNVTVSDSKWASGVEIKVDGSASTLTDSSYTIDTLDVDEVVTITYSYTVTDADVAAGKVTNSVTAHDGNDTEGDDTAEVPVSGTITITPADITIYMGGDKGYDAVVGDNDETTSSNSMPTPLFYVTVPSSLGNVDVSDIVLTGAENRKWEFAFAGYDSAGKALYYINSTGFTDQEPVRVTYTGSDGHAHISDSFNPSAVNDLFTTYEIAIYAGGAGKVEATVNGVRYGIATGTGTLHVRAVEDTEENPVVSVETTVTEPVASGEAAISAPANTSYTLNDTSVAVEPEGVGLLFDSIIDTDADRTGALLAALEDEYNIDIANGNYQAQYLDLVDANNGNAWVKASGNVTVYWGYPEGTDSSDNFTLYHFTDLHRDGSNSGFDIADIGSSDIEVVEVTKTAYGIAFEVEPGGFSPFVLVWSDTYNPPIIIPPVEPEEPDYTPNWLNTTDHFGYIIGYEDGTVKPNAGITRAEVATIFFRLLTDEARERFWCETNDYSDVADGSWYNNAVSTLSNMGILGGYEDGTFRPNASITRAEFAKIAVSFFDWADIEAVNDFVDVSDSAWYADYVAVAAEIGLIEGYGGNVFRPEAAITRAEACAIINRTLGRAPDAEHLLPESQMNTWPDNSDTGVWYYAHIQEATNSHDYSWIGDIEQWTEKLPEIDWDKFQY